MPNEVKYLNDEIGDSYQKWKYGDIILITASTGSGKSYFVLHTLLKWIIWKQGRLLYLVNRKALKNQIENELQKSVLTEIYMEFKMVTSLRQYIKVNTYQNIEHRLKGTSEERCNVFKELGAFDYVVYDECHYFYSDATFNTSTELSYDYLRIIFNNKIQIFMSATMGQLKENIFTRPPAYYPFSDISPTGYSTNVNGALRYKDRVQEYSMQPNYGYIEWGIFEDFKHLREIILDRSVGRKKDKWLIFVDSIERGDKLKAELVAHCDGINDKEGAEAISEQDVAFIDANYAHDEDATANMWEIIKNQRAGAKIVIATAVLDNGVSFHDDQLRNIVILNDIQESFIQMLGRKRKDGGKVTLYICKQNEKHFRNRLEYLNEILRFKDRHEESLKCLFNYWEENYFIYPAFYIYYMQHIKEYGVNITEQTFQRGKNISFKTYCQQNVIMDILNNERMYHAAKKICYSVDGILTINSFAVQQIIYLKGFYEDIIEKLKENENAFLERQMQWLGLDDSTIQQNIKNATIPIDERHRTKLEEEFEKVLGKELSEEENKDLKIRIRKDMVHFAKKERPNTGRLKTNATRVDATLSKEVFNDIMILAEMPYRMKKVSRGSFMIEKIPAPDN